MLTDQQWDTFDRTSELDIAYSIQGVGRFRVNVYRQRSSVGAAFRVDPAAYPEPGRSGPACQHRAICPPAARPGPGHRPDRLGQDDDARQPARRGQPHPQRPHHDHRGPHRVPPRARPLRRQPARGRLGHRGLRDRPAARAAPGPGRHPRRRAARPGDHLGGGHRGRNRPPRPRDAAHAVGGADDRPAHRHLPAAPAAADPRPARELPAGCRDAGARAHGGRLGPHGDLRGDGRLRRPSAT